MTKREKEKGKSPSSTHDEEEEAMEKKTPLQTPGGDRGRPCTEGVLWERKVLKGASCEVD